MIHNVKDIAKKIIAQANPDCGDIMTNMKLQKLLYYMQGFHLAFFDEPLFHDEIEAWMYGPVVPAVYEEYKACGSAGLDLNPDEDILSLNEEEEDMFNQVYEAYGQFSALKLMNMTHAETPWKSTAVGYGNVISKDKIKAYFSTQVEA
ncbi:MAG: DUF4065 domain-containing protein [Tannerellaceae bacterium]